MSELLVQVLEVIIKNLKCQLDSTFYIKISKCQLNYTLTILLKNNIINREVNMKIEKLCSEISHSEARSLYRKSVVIRENKSNLVFTAQVIDFCFDDQSGIIVVIKKSDVASILNNYDMGPAEHDPKNFVECDLRNIFYGNKFSILKGLEENRGSLQ